MLKQGLLTTFVALLFSMTTALADHHEEAHEGSKHPAHEMGAQVESDTDKKEQLSEEAKENLEAAKESENAPHPAHQMGDEQVLEERGQ